MPCTALPTLQMMAAESMLSKCPVLRFTVAVFFLLNVNFVSQNCL